MTMSFRTYSGPPLEGVTMKGGSPAYRVDGTANDADGYLASRHVTRSNYTDTEIHGWAIMDAEPVKPSQGFQLHVRHQHNDANLLVALLRGSRKTGVWVEDDYRPSAKGFTEWRPGTDHQWVVGEQHQWRVSARGSLVEAWCCGKPIIAVSDPLFPRMGQIGFRLDGVKARFDLHIKEL